MHVYDAKKRKNKLGAYLWQHSYNVLQVEKLSLHYVFYKYHTRTTFLTTAPLIKSSQMRERLETASSSVSCSHIVKLPHQYVFILLPVLKPGCSSAVSPNGHKGGKKPHLACEQAIVALWRPHNVQWTHASSLLGSWLISGLHRAAKAGSS